MYFLGVGSDLSFFMHDFINLSLFLFLIKLANGLSVLLILSKNQPLVLLICSTVLLVSVSLSSAWIFINSFLLLGVGLFYLVFFSSSFRCEVSLCIWVFSNFLREACIVMYFLLRTALAVSQKFWRLVSSFSLVSMNLFNSSLIPWLTHSSCSRMLFNLHVFEFLQISSCDWVLVSKHYSLEICREQSQSFDISWDLICDPVHGLFWRKILVDLRRMCIQLCWM